MTKQTLSNRKTVFKKITMAILILLSVSIFSCNSEDQFDGEWSAEDGSWDITITKVKPDLYDVRFHATQTVDWFKMANGTYNGYGTYISKEFPVDWNSSTVSNQIGKEYRIDFADDGKLYFAQKFFRKQNNNQ